MLFFKFASWRRIRIAIFNLLCARGGEKSSPMRISNGRKFGKVSKATSDSCGGCGKLPTGLACSLISINFQLVRENSHKLFDIFPISRCVYLRNIKPAQICSSQNNSK